MIVLIINSYQIKQIREFFPFFHVHHHPISIPKLLDHAFIFIFLPYVLLQFGV